MLATISIRAKITAVVAFLLLAMSAMGALSVRQIYAINSSTVDIVSSWLPSVRVLGELRAATITYRAIVRSHLLATDEAGKRAQEDLLAKWIDRVDQARKAYEPLITSVEERAIYNEFNVAWAEYLAGVKDVLVMSRKNEDNEARKLHAKASLAGVKADEALQKDVTLNNVGAGGAGTRAAESFDVAIKMVLTSLLLTMIVGIGAAILLVRDVAAGIKSIVGPMQALSGGDLTAEVPHQGENTEIGTMANALQVFKDALVAKKSADEAAARDAEAKIERGRRVDGITRDFESMIGDIVDIVSSASTQLEASAGTLTATAARSRELTTVVAAASEEASTNVQSVASATEEMTSSINEISRQVQESARMATEAVDQAHKTNDRVDQSIGAQRHHRGSAGRRRRPRLRGRGFRSEGAGRTDREGDRRDRPADHQHPVRDAGVGRCDQGDQRHHRETVGDFSNHRFRGGTAGRGDPGDFPQRPAGGAGHRAGELEYHRRAARRQRDRIGLVAGSVGGAVAVRREQPPQARGRQIPQLGQGGLTGPRSDRAPDRAAAADIAAGRGQGLAARIFTVG
jgi:methyl-accepting chemotaxis protein